jgi:GT2 family glycosyltransferase
MAGKAIDQSAVLPLIYAGVAEGVSLSNVLKRDGMPDHSTFWRWHMDDEDIRDNLARARENGVEVHFDACIDIADETSNDTVTGEDGVDRPNTEWISRSKLRIETRIKMAQMIKPRKYGPKLDMTSGGEPIDLAGILSGRRKKRDDEQA